MRIQWKEKGSCLVVYLNTTFHISKRIVFDLNDSERLNQEYLLIGLQIRNQNKLKLHGQYFVLFEKQNH